MAKTLQLNTSGTVLTNPEIFTSGNLTTDLAVAAGSNYSLVVNTTAILGASTVTIPSNVKLIFVNGGLINFSAGQTLIIAGPIESGLQKIFNYADSTCQIRFRTKTILYPEWWGATGGNATVDQPALVYCLSTHVDFADQSNNDLATTVVFSDIYNVTSGVDVAGTDYTSLLIKGATPSGNGGFRGCGIKYTGSTAVVMSGTPTLTFDRTARTIVRSSGSFSTDGFTAGMRILVADPTSGSVLNNRIYTIQTVSGATITVTAPAATYPTVGYATDGMMPYTEGPLSNFIVVQADHVLRIKGASGVVLEDVVIDGDHKALLPLWADIVPDDANATNLRQIRIERCCVFGRYPHFYGSNISFGRPSSTPAVGSDLNNTWVVKTVCQNDYIDNPPGACIRYWDGNNTKLHRVIACELWSAERLIDHSGASEGISIQDTHFENGTVALYNNGYAEMANCHSERVTMSSDGSRGRLLENNNSWNLSGSFIVSRQSSHEMHRCTYINTNVLLQISSINTGTGILTGANSSARTPVNGDEIVVRTGTGWLGMPGMLQSTWHDRASQIFYLADVTSIGGGSYTFSLRVSRSGSLGSYTFGAAVTFTSSGTDVWVLSPCMFTTSTGLSKPSGDGLGLSMDSCHILGALDVPLVGSVNGESVFDPYLTASAAVSGRASVKHCFGFTPGPVLFALAEISSVPVYGNAQIVPTVLYYAEQMEWVVRGVDGWSVARVRAASLASGTFRAGSFAIFYVDLPYRCGVELVTSEVVTSFAASGLSAATVKIGHTDVGQGDGDDDDAYLLSTSLMTFTNASDRRKGFAAGDRGVRLTTLPYFPIYSGATDWSWNNRMTMIVRIDLTGATLSQLSAGDLLLGFKLTQVPDWKRT
jgi:hypothetical protein